MKQQLLTCAVCDRAFLRYDSQIKSAQAYCSLKCRAIGYWSDKERITTNYGYTRNSGHPLADRYGVVGMHRVALYAVLGPGTHPCHHCGTPVTWSQGTRTAKGSLIVDHLDGNKRNNDVSNLVPSCQGCNSWRTRRVQDDELFVESANGHRRRAEWCECPTCGSTHLVASTFVRNAERRGRVFGFCDRSCARKYGRRRSA